ncbi:MAG: hypothetical protein H7222_08550 [Methylotenera sp.]|nr:hypothetical protein [Oligoflexia bacterium]
MPAFVVWIDRHEALLYQFSQTKMEHRIFKAENGSEISSESGHSQQRRNFHSTLASELQGAAKILILGPGVAKHHFQNHLAEQHPLLAKRVVGCESLEKATDSLVAAMARRFFKVGMTSPA